MNHIGSENNGEHLEQIDRNFSYGKPLGGERVEFARNSLPNSSALPMEVETLAARGGNPDETKF